MDGSGTPQLRDRASHHPNQLAEIMRDGDGALGHRQRPITPASKDARQTGPPSRGNIIDMVARHHRMRRLASGRLQRRQQMRRSLWWRRYAKSSRRLSRGSRYSWH